MSQNINNIFLFAKMVFFNIHNYHFVVNKY